MVASFLPCFLEILCLGFLLKGQLGGREQGEFTNTTDAHLRPPGKVGAEACPTAKVARAERASGAHNPFSKEPYFAMALAPVLCTAFLRG